MHLLQRLLLVILVATWAGCANPGVVQMSGDTFMLSRTSAGGLFANMSKLKAEVIQEANAFAESKGKMAVPISSKETPPGPGRLPSFEYQFRIVEKGSAASMGGALLPRADVVIENNNRDQQSKRPDLYSELLKLEDLKKRGLLSEQEFEAQKKRLLAGQQ